MNFTKAEPTENFPIARLTSENNLWEVGIYPVLFGVRVAANPVGDNCYTINYCAADNHGFAFILLATVVKILESLPETISESEVSKLFPGYKIRPIDRDEECWGKLQQMVIAATTKTSGMG